MKTLNPAKIRSWLLPLIVTTAAFFLAGGLAKEYLPDNTEHGYRLEYNNEWYANWDGQWYKHIALKGYKFRHNSPTLHGPKAFFPVYPILARALHKVTHLKVDWCLLAVSLASLTGFCAGLP